MCNHIKVRNCSGCSNLSVDRYYTADSWDYTVRGSCVATSRSAPSYRDYEKEIPNSSSVGFDGNYPIPDWCPLIERKTEMAEKSLADASVEELIAEINRRNKEASKPVQPTMKQLVEKANSVLGLHNDSNLTVMSVLDIIALYEADFTKYGEHIKTTHVS